MERVGENYLEKFDLIRGPVPRSGAILKILAFFIEYDPQYLRTILKLGPMTEEEILQLKAEIIPKNNKEIQVAEENSCMIQVRSEENSILPMVLPEELPVSP
jgi:hypothetical protein